MPAPNALALQLAQDLAAQVAIVIERVSWTPPKTACEAVTADAVNRGADFLDLSHTLSVVSGATIWIGAERDAWLAIGTALLPSSTGEAVAVEESAARERYREFALQTMAAFAQNASSRVGIAIEAAPADNLEAPEALESCFRIDIDIPEHPCAIFVAFPPALLQWFEKRIAESVQGNKSFSAAAVDLLLDVELPLSVSFGRAMLPVREILRLSTGSLIELNRHVKDHVDVIVNNCVIARGEVVIIEGNYGIRVHEIVSRRERAMLQQMSAAGQSPMKASA